VLTLEDVRRAKWSLFGERFRKGTETIGKKEYREGQGGCGQCKRGGGGARLFWKGDSWGGIWPNGVGLSVKGRGLRRTNQVGTGGKGGLELKRTYHVQHRRVGDARRKNLISGKEHQHPAMQQQKQA